MPDTTNILNHPKRLPLVLPSILGADFADLAGEIESVMSLGADAIHVDIMDGRFVPNLTMGPALVHSLRKRFPDLYMDVHLMVQEPERYVQPFADAGANNLSFHIEATCGRRKHDEHELIAQVRRAGCQVGVAINPPTTAASVQHLVDAVDMILVMSVHPGFAGQSFMPEVLPKARALRDLAPATVRIEMDGGLGPDNIAAVRNAGVDAIVAASSVFSAADRASVMKALRG